MKHRAVDVGGIHLELKSRMLGGFKVSPQLSGNSSNPCRWIHDTSTSRLHSSAFLLTSTDMSRQVSCAFVYTIPTNTNTSYSKYLPTTPVSSAYGPSIVYAQQNDTSNGYSRSAFKLPLSTPATRQNRSMLHIYFWTTPSASNSSFQTKP